MFMFPLQNLARKELITSGSEDILKNFYVDPSKWHEIKVAFLW